MKIWDENPQIRGSSVSVWEVQGSSGGWDECFREGEQTQLHLFKTCNWVMWQKLTRSPISLSLFSLTSDDDWMMGQVGLRHYPLVTQAPIPIAIILTPDLKSLISIAAIILASTRDLGHEVRGNQNKPLFTQSLIFSLQNVFSCDGDAMRGHCSVIGVEGLYRITAQGEVGGDTGGGGWWDLTTTKHQEMEIIWAKLMQEMTFNLPTKKQLSLLLRRSLTWRDSYLPINCSTHKRIEWIFFTEDCSWCKYDPPRWHNYRCVDMRHDTTWVIRSGIQCRMLACGPNTGSLTNVHKTPETWALGCYLMHCTWLYLGLGLLTITLLRCLCSVYDTEIQLHNSLQREIFQCNSQRCTEIFWKVSKITYRNNCKTLMQNI